MKKATLKLITLVFILASSGCFNNREDRMVIDSLQETGSIFESDSIHFDIELFENANVFLDIDYYEEIDVYNHPQGEVIYKIKNDSIREDYILFGLIDKSDNMFFVTAYSSLSNSILAKGWIKKNSHLGIFSSMYQGNMFLYEKPDENSIVKNVIEHYSPDMYEVLDFRGKWLKITAKGKGKSIEGWMPPEEQCCNVYSTCN